MIKVKDKNGIQSSDMIDYISLNIKQHQRIYVNRNDILNSILSLGNKFIPGNLNLDNFYQLLDYGNRSNDQLKSLYDDWLSNFENKYHDLLRINDAELCEFFQYVIELTLYNKLYRFLIGETDSLKTINKCINLIDLYSYVFNNPNVWVKDNDDWPNLELTLIKYKFLRNKKYEDNGENQRYLINILSHMISDHINSNGLLSISDNSSITEINDNIALFSSAKSVIGICFNEELLKLVQFYNVTTPRCKCCNKLFIKEHSHSTYCSDKCRKKANKNNRKSINNRYNHSEKGIKRYQNFHKRKDSK